MTHSKPFIYNPAQKTKEQLIAEFVVRKNIFEKILDELISSPKDLPPQHYLLIGQRGMGKTTLLLRLMYAIEDEPALNDFLLPIRFSEEQYNITRLEHLWEETATLLELKNPIYEGLHSRMFKYENEDNYERKCFEIFENELKQHHHRVLLLIDNIGDLFEKFPTIQNNRFREVLMTSPFFQLMGLSSKVLEHTFHYDKPFFDFFNELKLEPLDQASTVELLRTLGKEYQEEERIENIIINSPERIDVLRRITGGVPRTIVLLFDIFIDNSDSTAFDDLQLLLDEVNSLYKHRMDELKPQQQQIIDTLARAWEPITASEVLEQSKLYRENIKTNQISAQLKQLTENQVVETLEGKGRNRTYRLRERFFNIWYLMRHGRKQSKEEVLWLIKFLEAWCTIKDLKKLTAHQIEGMRAGKYSEKGDMSAMYNLALLYDDVKKEYDKAETYYLMAIEKGDVPAMHNLVLLLLERDKIQEALTWAGKLVIIEKYYENPEKVIFLIKKILTHKQYNFLLNLYKEENSLLMKQASPFYYVLAYFMKEELPGVYEKAGSEIKETVDEIIKSIENEPLSPAPQAPSLNTHPEPDLH